MIFFRPTKQLFDFMTKHYKSIYYLYKFNKYIVYTSIIVSLILVFFYIWFPSGLLQKLSLTFSFMFLSGIIMRVGLDEVYEYCILLYHDGKKVNE